MPKIVDLEYWIGSNFQFEFHILDRAETQAVNITGWQLSFMVKRRNIPIDSAALLTKTTGAGAISIVGTYLLLPTTNLQRAIVPLTPADILVPGEWIYEIIRTDEGFRSLPLTHGKFVAHKGLH